MKAGAALLLGLGLGAAVGWYLGVRQACPGAPGTPWELLRAKLLDAAGAAYCRSRS